MARRRREAENPVSLFPFLAVLVCAMGVLIFLLIVSTSRIRSQMMQAMNRQEQEKKEKAQPVIPAVVEKLPEPFLPVLPKSQFAPKEILSSVERNPNDAVKSELTAWQKRIRDEQAIQKRLQESLSSLRESSGSTNRKIMSQRNKIDSTSHENRQQTNQIADLADEKERKKFEIAKLARMIELKKQERDRDRANVSTKYEIVPYEGRTGTTRRPILIECTERGLTLLPEDITLSLANLEGFTTANNPLLNSVKALVNYWHSKDRAESGDPNEPLPYVLLIVRPSGSLPFYAARKMLSKLDVSFGYELVEEDWEFAIPEPDLQARSLARSAIRETIRQGRFLIQNKRNFEKARENEYVASDGRSIRFHRNSGTFEVVKPGKNSHGDSSSRFRGDRNGSTPNRKPGNGYRNPSSELSNNRRSNPFGQKTTTDSSGRRFSGSRFENNSGSQKRNPTNSNPFGTGRTGTENKRTPSQGQQGRQGTEQGSHPLEEPGRLPYRPGRNLNQPRGAFDSSGNRSENLRKIDEWRKTQESRRQKKEGRREGGNGGTDAGHRNEQERDFFNSRERNRTESGSSTRSGQRFSRDRTSQGQSSSNNTLVPVPVPNPFATSQSGSPKLQPLKSKSRWGFSSPRAMIGFEREIKIEVSEKFATIGRDHSFSVSTGTENSEIAREFVSAVEKKVRSWGHPPERFYWIPSIRFQIAPGGLPNAERLKSIASQLRLPAKIDLSFDRQKVNSGRRIDEK